MPSYEHEDGKGMLVLDLLVVNYMGDGQIRFFSRSYGEWSVVAPDGPVPMWHDPEALWCYRPIIYRMTMDGYPQAQGSQIELEWRRKLCDMITSIHVEDFDFPDHASADERAREILEEHLSPQQRIELRALSKFRVRGGKTKNVYLVEPGNGFKLVSKLTTKVMVSYCLHPEEHIPFDDVALATKLWLEDEETELEILEGARQYVRSLGETPFSADRFAERLERDLIA